MPHTNTHTHTHTHTGRTTAAIAFLDCFVCEPVVLGARPYRNVNSTCSCTSKQVRERENERERGSADAKRSKERERVAALTKRNSTKAITTLIINQSRICQLLYPFILHATSLSPSPSPSLSLSLSLSPTRSLAQSCHLCLPHSGIACISKTQFLVVQLLLARTSMAMGSAISFTLTPASKVEG